MQTKENLRFLLTSLKKLLKNEKFQILSVYFVSLLIILTVYKLNPTYGIYLFRWQLSTPTLAIFSAFTISKLSKESLRWANKYEWAGATVANIIGGLMFFWFDKILIFNA